jgi:hypothetical protein
MLNPSNIYMAEKIQSARGNNIKGKDLISGTGKVSNLLMHRDKVIKPSGIESK